MISCDMMKRYMYIIHGKKILIATGNQKMTNVTVSYRFGIFMAFFPLCGGFCPCHRQPNAKVPTNFQV